MRSIAGPFTLLAITSLGVVACSASSEDDGNSSSGTGGSGAGNGSGGDGGSLIGTGGGSTETLGCSSDLQYVVDEQGVVVKQCPPDQGCSGGECVAACQAAADSQGNVGCDFTVATPHFYVGIAPPCFAVFLANNWPKDAQVTITRGGQSYDVTTFGRIPNGADDVTTWPAVPATGLPPQEVAVLFLSQDPSSINGGQSLNCPVAPAISMAGGSAVSGTGMGDAWHIVTDVPVSAYDILPYGGAKSFLPSAELLLPTTAWGTNYISVLPPASSGPPWGQLTAFQDGTVVDVVPTVALPGGGAVPAGPANVVTQFTLDAGQYIQWQGAAMTGTVLSSNNPVAFTGGDAYICYSSATSSGGGCDSAHQQIPPVAAFGMEYVAPPYRTRGSAPESIGYRLLAAVDGTTLTYDPPIPGAPATLDSGEVFDFETTLAFRAFSQDEDHPFYVGQIMAGNGVAGNNDGKGDEEYVNILPPAQWLSKYVFFTDPTYPTTNLVVVRAAIDGAFSPVDVECLGPIEGWTDVGTDGRFQVTNVDLVRESVPVGTCSNGSQVAESDAPFGVMVWGLDTFSSYAYPAGGNVAPINKVVVPPTPK